MKLESANRKQAKIKMGIMGIAGGGKTMSALLIAFGITQDWNKIAVIDSENQSSHLYAHLGSYKVLNLEPPFTPERYIQAIEVCEKAGIEVIILDSISHEWEGRGGILDIHSNMAGNSFTNWSKLTPRHNSFVEKMLQSNCHIIATIRSKQDYVLNEKNGKQIPEKVGLKGVTREGMDYEFTLVLEVDIKHNAIASKDRTGIFVGKPEFRVTFDTGRIISEWCNEGTTIDQIKSQIENCKNLEELKKLYIAFPELQKNLKIFFVTKKAELEKQELLNEHNFNQNGTTSH
jgi:hypothetical protein